MLLPDGTVLMHAGAPYDAKKAHEYYLRNRKLHPRIKNDKSQTSSGSYTITTAQGQHIKLSAKQLQEQKVYAAARTIAITKKLATLKKELRKRVEEAQVRARDANKPMTQAEKAKAAKEAKAYREKHHQDIANKGKTAAAKAPAATATKSKQTSIVDLKVEIMDTKRSLKAAVAKQRELITAKKNG